MFGQPRIPVEHLGDVGPRIIDDFLVPDHPQDPQSGQPSRLRRPQNVTLLALLEVDAGQVETVGGAG